MPEGSVYRRCKPLHQRTAALPRKIVRAPSGVPAMAVKKPGRRRIYSNGQSKPYWQILAVLRSYRETHSEFSITVQEAPPQAGQSQLC